jgi:hypothetical protein
MKIAVATTDGSLLSPHFGRSAGFIIFDIADNAITSRELRPNRHTPHAQGQCEGHHDNGHHGHDHGGIATCWAIAKSYSAEESARELSPLSRPVASVPSSFLAHPVSKTPSSNTSAEHSRASNRFAAAVTPIKQIKRAARFGRPPYDSANLIFLVSPPLH